MDSRTPAEVVDIDIEQLQRIVSAAAGDQPTPGGVIAIPERLLLRLRKLDQEIADRQSEMRFLVDGFIAGSRIDLDHESVEINIATGAATVTPLPAPLEE